MKRHPEVMEDNQEKEKEVKELLSKSETKILRVTWCGTNNVIRAKGVHKDNMDAVFRNGVGLCTGVMVRPACVGS